PGREVGAVGGGRDELDVVAARGGGVVPTAVGPAGIDAAGPRHGRGRVGILGAVVGRGAVAPAGRAVRVRAVGPGAGRPGRGCHSTISTDSMTTGSTGRSPAP